MIAHVESEKLIATANRCRVLVEQSHFSATDRVSVTVSIGATVALGGDTLESIIKRADQLLYRSKAAGRNTVTAG